ncbi:MAG: hypothetical protein AB1813_02550 [Verrucomicrobiota bacterium]
MKSKILRQLALLGLVLAIPKIAAQEISLEMKRDQIRAQFSEQRQLFLELQISRKMEIRQRLAELRVNLKDHREILEAALRDAQAKRRRGRD